MTQSIHLIAEYYCIPIPEGATQIEALSDECNDTAIAYKGTRHLVENEYDILATLSGNWQIICTTKGAKIQDLVQIVEGIDSEGRGFIFKNYQNGMYVFARAASSLRSLLTSKALDPNKNYLIIKKVS
jgi:hypothetical protein